MVTPERPLRIALLSYRSKPHCGGQGVYVRHLSRELDALGHRVEVFSGQPYPELDPGPGLTRVPSLDLYRDGDPFRTPHWHEYRDWADVLETAMMWSGAFPEPLTFSIRVQRALAARAGDFDVVHDNQGLGYGLLGLGRPRIWRLGPGGPALPLVASIHHPISVDKRIDLASVGPLLRLWRRRWYGFVRMQARVARQIARSGSLITVSASAKSDICRDFKVPPDRVRVIPLGVDARLFRPRQAARVPGRIIAVASADSALKGIATLLHAVAKLVTDRDAHLIIVGRPTPATERLAAQLSIADRVTFTHGLDDQAFSALLASAEIAVVPSLYEGFSLPAIEHMASGTPLVASRSGALPEVTGDAAALVTPADSEELAGALRRLHDSPAERAVLADRALRRVGERFAWPAVAQATVAQYREAQDRQAPGGPVLTVDFRRFPIRPGQRVLDLGCGGGRHAFEVYRRGGNVVAFDLDPAELGPVRSMFAAMREAGEGTSAGAAAVSGDATGMPFGDGVFDRVIAAEVLEHVLDDQRAMNELARVLRPGGLAAVTVPSWLPERICWALSTEYYEVPGGHVRIYTRVELEAKLARAGLSVRWHHYAHGLHSPYWWLKCAAGVHDDKHPLVSAYHRMLVWDIMRGPAVTRLAEKALNPVIGKSLVVYAVKTERSSDR